MLLALRLRAGGGHGKRLEGRSQNPSDDEAGEDEGGGVGGEVGPVTGIAPPDPPWRLG